MASSIIMSASPDVRLADRSRHAALCAICLVTFIVTSISLVLALTFSGRCKMPHQQVFRQYVHVLIKSISHSKSGTLVVVLIQHKDEIYTFT